MRARYSTLRKEHPIATKLDRTCQGLTSTTLINTLEPQTCDSTALFGTEDPQDAPDRDIRDYLSTSLHCRGTAWTKIPGMESIHRWLLQIVGEPRILMKLAAIVPSKTKLPEVSK